MPQCLNFVVMNNIFIDNLSIGYGHQVIAEGLTARISGGQLTCLIGRNGLGKSTLLHTLAGSLSPMAGSVRLDIDGKTFDLSLCPRTTLSRLVAVVLTEKIDISNMTVGEVVAMGRMPYTDFFGTLSRNDRRIVTRALEATGMAAFASRDFAMLSDGERQKVMIARALAQQTPVVLLDEPTAFLDFPSKVETMRLLADMAKSMGKIVLASTHDLGIALRMAGRIMTIDNGLRDVSREELRSEMDEKIKSPPLR